MAEDSKKQNEESEIPTDSSTTKVIDEKESESTSKLISEPEIKDGDQALSTLENHKSEDSEIQKQEKAKNHQNQTNKTISADDKIEGNDHSFNFHEFLEHDLFDSIRSKKDQIFRYTAALIGAILIIYGIVLISATVTKVADNVIFGEGASFAAFSILLGFLIIVAAFSKQILNRTFLKNISSELEIAEGKSEFKDEKIEEVDGNTDNKNDKDNNGNIVGEDKK